MSEIIFEIEALTDNLPNVLEYIDSELEKMDCPFKVQMQIDIAVEEIFVNIASYAYAPDTGKATIKIESGVPYDPLKKQDPDVTLSADEREIGGLGIFMVKKSMDDMFYEYKDGQNILTIVKKF